MYFWQARNTTASTAMCIVGPRPALCDEHWHSFYTQNCGVQPKFGGVDYCGKSTVQYTVNPLILTQYIVRSMRY